MIHCRIKPTWHSARLAKPQLLTQDFQFPWSPFTCNVVSHWLSPCLEWSLLIYIPFLFCDYFPYQKQTLWGRNIFVKIHWWYVSWKGIPLFVSVFFFFFFFFFFCLVNFWYRLVSISAFHNDIAEGAAANHWKLSYTKAPSESCHRQCHSHAVVSWRG